MDPLDEAPNGLSVPLYRTGSSFGHAVASTSNADPLYPLTEDDMLGLFLQSNVPQDHSYHPTSPELQISTPVTDRISDYHLVSSTPSLPHDAGTPNMAEDVPEVASMDGFSLPNSLSASLRALGNSVPSVLKTASENVSRPPNIKLPDQMLSEASPLSFYSRADPSEQPHMTTNRRDCKKPLELTPPTPRRTIERRHYRRRKQHNLLSRPPGICDPWASDGAPERAPRDAIVVKGEQMLGEVLSRAARKEGDALYEHLIHSVCEFTEENKARERSRLQNEASDDQSEMDSKIASRIEAKLSRHKKDVYIAALVQQVKNLCEDLCVLKSVAANHIPGLAKDQNCNNVPSHTPKHN